MDRLRRDRMKKAINRYQCGNYQKNDTEFDSLTGLYHKAAFFRKAQERVKQSCGFCLAAIDIGHFKLYNKWYGREQGDRFLEGLGAFLKEESDQRGLLCGYMGGDDFAVLLPDDGKSVHKLAQNITDYTGKHGNRGMLVVFGICSIKDPDIEIPAYYDCALLAQSQARGNYACRVSWYEEAMLHGMEEEQQLLGEILEAFEKNEFIVYAQPQCNIVTGKIVGLEALVRWKHPEKGIIGPSVFIPLLEKHGLITALDVCVWEKVCAGIRAWIDEGRRPVPVSVNLSRHDIYTMDVVALFNDLVRRYRLDPVLIEIEITEGTYVQDYEKIIKVVDELHRSGFMVWMDDFGTGYSSLNMLKNVSIDVLKLDMKLLSLDIRSARKGMSILEAVVRMASGLGMKMIAEGVETREQAELLLDIGCLYAQGFYFYYPEGEEELRHILSGEEKIDYRGILAKPIQLLDVTGLTGRDAGCELFLNHVLGGLAVYDMYEGRLELKEVNTQYYRITKEDPVDLEEHRKDPADSVYEPDRGKFSGLFVRAEQEPEGAVGRLRWLCADGSILRVLFRVYFAGEYEGHKVFYGMIKETRPRSLLFCRSSERSRSEGRKELP